jgi:hypothetical protein
MYKFVFIIVISLCVNAIVCAESNFWTIVKSIFKLIGYLVIFVFNYF